MEKYEKEYLELYELLKKYNHHYYDLDKPLVDDAEYDKLLNRLIILESRYPQLQKEDSPSIVVGGNISKGFKKVIHDPPMLSLNKIHSLEELFEFDEQCRKHLNENS